MQNKIVKDGTNAKALLAIGKAAQHFQSTVYNYPLHYFLLEVGVWMGLNIELELMLIAYLVLE